MVYRSFLVLGLLLSGGCSRAPQGPGGGDGNAGPSEMDLYEVVVRHLLPRAGGAGAGRPTVYIALPDDVPADRFCARFKDQAVAVRPLPGAGALPRGDYVIRIQSVSGANVQWQGPGKVRVFVLDYPAGETLKCGTPYPVPLARVGGRWVVVPG
jgi:hypothetical protein